MAAKKSTELAMEPEPFETDISPAAPADDVIVLKKSLVVNIGVAVLFFLIGAAASYVMFVLPDKAALAQALQQAQGQVAAQPTAAPARIDNVGLGKLPPDGNVNAKVKIVEFSDFQCPYCKQWNDTTFQPLRDKYGDKIVVYYRHYPLVTIHPEAMNGAIAAECANAQGKFWQMHDALFSTQALISISNSESLATTIGLDAQKFNDCMTNNPYKDNIAADIADGDAYGVSGTPTFFVNGVRLVGALPLAQFAQVIDQELAK